MSKPGDFSAVRELKRRGMVYWAIHQAKGPLEWFVAICEYRTHKGRMNAFSADELVETTETAVTCPSCAAILLQQN